MKIPHEKLLLIQQNSPELKTLTTTSYVRYIAESKYTGNFLELCAALKNNTRVHSINLANLLDSDFALKVDDVATFVKSISIKRLNISNNNVCVKGAMPFANNATLIVLTAQDCNLTDRSVSYIAKNPSIKILNLANNHIGQHGAEILAANQVLTTLNLRNNNIGDGIEAFGANQTLTKLVVSSNYMSLANLQTLLTNTHIEELELHGDGVHGVLGDDIAQAILENDTLQKLTITSSRMTDAGAALLATHPSLTSLDLSHNLITNQGLEVLAGNRKLQKLNLAFNAIKAVNQQAFAANPESKLTSLDLSRNQIKDAGAIALSQIPQLKYLNIASNQIGDLGMRSFLNKLSLRRLDSSENCVSGQLMREIVEPKLSFFQAKNIQMDDSSAVIQGQLSCNRIQLVMGVLALRQLPKVMIPNDILNLIASFVLPTDIAEILPLSLLELPQEQVQDEQGKQKKSRLNSSARR